MRKKFWTTCQLL